MGKVGMKQQEPTDTQATRHKVSPELPVPQEFTRQALPTPSGGGDASNDRQQPAPPLSSTEPSDADARERFAEATHQYVREYIRHADQKASFLFTGATALLAFLYKNDISSRWLKPVMLWNILDTLAFLAMTALALAVLFALWVVVPRTSGSRRGYLFWEAIAEYDNGRQYSDELRLLSRASLCQIKAEHCFELAKVCRAKYRILRIAIRTGAVGLAAAVLVFLFV